MRIAMPDVNVLVALMDNLHVHHEEAKKWFDVASKTGWATCPLSIAGALRVISRPQPEGALRVVEVRDLLSALIQANSTTHRFWTDPVNLLDEDLFDISHLQGYWQVTDLHLLAIALLNNGTLVTLDAGLEATLKAVRTPPAELFNVLSK